MLLCNRKLFLSIQKELKLIYLWASIGLELWLDMYFNHQKSIDRVIGYGSLVFPVKL